MCKAGQQQQREQEQRELSAEDAWIGKLDLKAFGAEIRELGKTLRANQGKADDEHLYKLVRWQTGFTLAGLLTMWMAPNPFTVICLSTGLFMRWAMLAHHVCHNGYKDTDAGKKFGYNQLVFAVGSLVRRIVDWADWIYPEAWNLEHGRLHHYSLNESADPDVVELNTRYLQESGLPRPVKYLVVLFFGATWKFTYYSSNTYSALLHSRRVREATLKNDEVAKARLQKEALEARMMTIFSIFDGSTPSWWSTSSFLLNVIMPFLVLRFVATPLPIYFLLGADAYRNAVVNLLLAEILTNMHSFLAIVPNHAGNDMYRFDTHCEPLSDEFFLRQVIGSVDFAVGNDVIDTFHGFLSYQIEHHLWPDLSMLSYQKAHPLVKDICKRHGVPFVQESVFLRLYKTVQIFLGDAHMREFPQNALRVD
uniref:Omega3 desaturase n=1 Tax=Thraustochytrium sp. (strain ATCC 26185 / S-3) TaxID=672127 RepID=A0A1B3PEH7_THRS2|nr:omega3 desaturase [Thraustochytrium sp. ATCC 26185]